MDCGQLGMTSKETKAGNKGRPGHAYDYTTSDRNKLDLISRTVQ